MAAAVSLFADRGYGETGLADVMQRADVSKGAFYYHFESKEALASAIIDDGITHLLETFGSITNSSSPALENTIRATFTLAEILHADTTARIANQLRQALGQVSASGADTYQHSCAAFRREIGKALAQGDLRSDIDPDEVGETLCAGVLGGHLLSDAIGDDPFARLARTWRVLLRSIVPDHSVKYFHDFLGRIALQYSPRAGLNGLLPHPAAQPG